MNVKTVPHRITCLLGLVLSLWAGLSTVVRAQSAVGSFDLITPNFDTSLLKSVSFSYSLTTTSQAGLYNLTIANTSNNSLSTWVSGSKPTITDIYFDDSALNLLSNFSILSSNAVAPDYSVSYSVGTSGNLPGGNNIGFNVTDALNPSPPPSKSGIDPGEWLKVSFQSQASFNSLFSALSTGNLQIGMHVQEIGTSGQSASFVNSTPTLVPVPEPGSAILLGAFGLVLLMRRRSRLSSR